MGKNLSTNLPVISVENAVEILSKSYISLIKAGAAAKDFPSVMLWGPPGVGKSQSVRQIARRIEKETKKTVNVTDVRLLLFNPIDLRGIPVANADKTLAVWLKPKIFEMDCDKNTVNILFLDEISAAPQSVQAAAYQLTLDRVVGEHKLPDNCIVIAAGNRVTDKSVAFKMPKALANRLLHIEIEGSFRSWRKWAVENGINKKVLGYLSFRNDRLFGFDTRNDDLAFATPRSWEMVSNILNCVNGDAKETFPLIAGLVGSGTAIEFQSWCNVYADLPDIDSIFEGRAREVPKSPDAMYALVSSMTAYCREHIDNYEQIGNSIAYAELMPADFTQLLIQNYQSIELTSGDFLMSIPEYRKCISKKGSMRNGYGE